MRISPFLPRPEYPRPDRQRSFVHGVDWLNLNGAWEFRFDANDAGVGEEWFAPNARSWSDQIIVPFCWESLAAWGEADAAGNDNYFSRRVYRNPLEVTRFNYRDAARYEIGWYRRTVQLPQNEHWRGKRVILTIGAADFVTDCWCNGVHLGRHEGGYAPLEFDLTDAIETETATVVIRVEDRMANSEQPVGKQWGWYSSVSGIWQTVFIEPRAAECIERFEFVAGLAVKQLRVKAFTRGGAELVFEATAPSGKRYSANFQVANNVAAGVVPIDPLELWDPTTPQLYRATLTLRGGGIEDVVHTYFGMRSLAAEPAAESGAPAALALNGEAIYLRGALYQSYHCDGVYTAADVQVLEDDIAHAKRCGFDLLRVHIKVDDPLLLYYADTLGILLMCDFPNFGEGGDTALGRERYEATMRAAVARDFNHPSIVAWCLFNETWGFGGQSEFVKLINPSPPATGDAANLASEDAYRWVGAMWNLAKRLDPTRLVEDMSVVAWAHLERYGHGQTDVNSWHFYSGDYEHSRREIERVVEQTYTGSHFNYVPGFEQGAQPLINSEYGGVGALDGDIDVSWSFKFLTNELRRHEKLSAYIFTELHDVEWERNGFLNYDRTPKEFGYDPRIVNQGDVLPIDAPPISRRAPGEEVEVAVFSSHFARRTRENVTLHWRLRGVDSTGWVHEDLARGSQPIDFPHYQVRIAQRIRLRMPERTMLCRLWVGAVAENGDLVARNYIEFFVDAGFPAVEQNNGARILRSEAHRWSASKWSGESSSSEAAQSSGSCYAVGHGYFGWRFAVDQRELARIESIRVLCEASARRDGTPQTDTFAFPTTFRMLLNDVPIYTAVLPNHPHDATGSLTYLRGGRGAYGYLAHAAVDGALLEQVLTNSRAGGLRLRCAVPAERTPHGGLTIYGGDCGRYPIPPTLIVTLKPE
jgi:hypothetical protein